MATENTTLMQSARKSLENNWGIAIITFLIYTIIISVGSYAAIVIAGPFALGLALFSLNISRGKELKIEQIFQGFNRFVDGLIAYLLILLNVFLWALLFIIPGIIKAFSYAMTYFIMIDEPELSPQQAMKKSQEMMDGYKMKYFRLTLRFMGWSLLCILTLGIGFLWLVPYMYVTNAKFYEDLKTDPLQEIGIEVNN
ncbi:putative membrane protein [Wenyingzhuangia heitensis]|uniref:Membrane protein n=1 Tax=Wenyingzhuangia heitensis TaxID=1487859 RepID=A0ABX0UB37_9FLAO|nr:DUF975 family protein [Wenyingzhuangia heitensis]NIJ44371.1 putative membrane protein [Wenyingzhuangia heitensis]